MKALFLNLIKDKNPDHELILDVFCNANFSWDADGDIDEDDSTFGARLKKGKEMYEQLKKDNLLTLNINNGEDIVVNSEGKFFLIDFLIATKPYCNLIKIKSIKFEGNNGEWKKIDYNSLGKIIMESDSNEHYIKNIYDNKDLIYTIIRRKNDYRAERCSFNIEFDESTLGIKFVQKPELSFDEKLEELLLCMKSLKTGFLTKEDYELIKLDLFTV